MRLFVFPKDLVIITGFSDGYCRKLIRDIKEKNGKEKTDKVAYTDLADFLKLSPDQVVAALKL